VDCGPEVKPARIDDKQGIVLRKSDRLDALQKETRPIQCPSSTFCGDIDEFNPKIHRLKFELFKGGLFSLSSDSGILSSWNILRTKLPISRKIR
jgi:hypothetical protein